MEQIILFAFLAIFPFGQIVKVGIVNPLDVVVGIGALYAIIKKFPRPQVFKYFNAFVWVLGFSWIFGALLFQRIEAIYGLFYFVRITAYIYFLVFVSHFKDRKLLLHSLLAVSVISAVFGWLQYFFYKDLRFLFYLGWDDHLGRMTGTFLDPAFLGIVLVLGLIIALEKKQKGVILFLLASIAFTYSRASYLAAFIPLLYKKTWLFIMVFIAMIMLLPRTEGVGVKLERTFSIERRFENYTETIQIFKRNALFGVGFNNICLAKNADFSSHSCSGADSSLLFLLATAGVTGVISFIYLILGIWQQVKDRILLVSFFVILVHSLFSNSVFYPWVMGYLIILLAVFQSKIKPFS